jgi:phosphonate transport system permease protein
MKLAREGPVEGGGRGLWQARAGFSLRRRAWGVAWVVAIAGSLVLAGVGRNDTVNADGLPQLGNFFEAALHPRLDSDFLELTWNASLVTLSFAVLGTALSLVIGLVAGAAISEAMWRSAAGSRRRRSTAGWLLARALLVVPRGIHEVVWGLLLLSVLGLDPMVAVLAIGIPYGAVSAKVFAEILDEAPRAPFDAITASGARRPVALLYSLFPATLPDIVSYSFYRFECAIRGAAILGLVGAGGLGFELALSFQALRYEEMWTLLYALILLSGAADLWSTVVRMRARRARGRRDRVLAGSVVGAALLVPLAAWQVELDPLSVFAGRARELFGDALAGAWPPDFGGGTLQLVAEASVDTMAMSVIAIAIAFAGGAALAFPAAAGARIRGSPLRKAGTAAVALASRSLLLFLRAVPPPVSAFLLLLTLFPGVLPGALALGLYNLGILGRLMAEAVENFDNRAAEALEAGGATPAQAFLYGTVPGIAPRFLAYGLYRWEVAIRETAVVGVVGAGGLGVLLAQRIAAFDYAGVTTVLAALIALTLVVDFLSAAMRGALARG